MNINDIFHFHFQLEWKKSNYEVQRLVTFSLEWLSGILVLLYTISDEFELPLTLTNLSIWLLFANSLSLPLFLLKQLQW